MSAHPVWAPDRRALTQTLAGVGLGGLAAIIVLASTATKPVIAFAAIVAVPLLGMALVRPRYAMLAFLFCMAFVEEFPGGIGDHNAGGDETQRSARTPFYSATLGIPSLYLPDVMIGGLSLLYLFKYILWREPLPLRLDKIGVGLAILLLVTMLSIIVPLWRIDPFGPPVLDLSTLGSIKLTGKNVSDVARYLPVLQYKLFVLFFAAYMLGLFFFRDERDIDQTIRIVGIAMAATVVLAVSRLARDPGMVRLLVPVVFDTGSVALMAMTVFYLIGRWTSGHYPPTRSVLYTVLCGLLMLFILLSFRRTMWGAIACAIVFFPFLLPRRAVARLFVVVSVGFCVGLVLAAVTPAGQALVQSVLSRAGETNLNESSTLYRFAIMSWVVENIGDLPLFGYGLRPLWDEKVYIRFFVISMENVHSLYIWVLARMGLVGMLGTTVMVILAVWRMWEVFRAIQDERYRLILAVIFLGLVMFLFNGIFNPVYANVRHVVPLGLSLAIVTQLPGIVARRGRGQAKAETS